MRLTHAVTTLAACCTFALACLSDGSVAGDDTSPVPDIAVAETSAPDTSVPAPDTATHPPETSAPDVQTTPETSAPAETSAPGETSVAPFVVHEWGTFTSVQDTKGRSQPGLHHEDEELPAFVHRRDLGPNAYFEELPEEPLQQLETPVIYFHSDRAREVVVEVDFPEGIISQWYPDATDYAPLPYEMSAIANGTMRWDLSVDPAIDPASFLAVSPEEIWAPSRNVASTPVRYVNGAFQEHEQFIFYRGLGNFELPVRTSAAEGDRVRIANDSDDDLAAVVILNRTADGGAVRVLGSLAARDSVAVPIPRALEPIDAYVAKAHAALVAAVVATGLYEDEAVAMVDTWTRSWFGNVGVRVLYLVPPSWTDRLLPIRITPAPDELVRTLVGRIEVLTSLDETETRDRIEKLGDAPTWQDIEATIDELGRFAEPRIRQAIEAHGTSPAGAWLLDAAHQRP